MRWTWSAATAAVLVVGAGLRVALDVGAVGDRSAAVMMALLGLSAWATTVLLATARSAFLVTLGLVALLNVAALPPRNTMEFDERQALYRTDQELAAQLVASPATAPVLTLLVEPTYAGAQPRFGLGGGIGGTTLAWDCPFQHGIQRLALPLPAAALAGAGSVDLRLHLTGSPARESDYLLVYSSSVRGSPLVSVIGAAEVGQGGVTCSLR